MWCANCQDDVATEISADGQAIKCITCGEQVRQVFAPSLHPETKSARDLLQKWAEEQKQQLGKVADAPADKTSQSVQSENPESEVASIEQSDKTIDSKPLETESEPEQVQVERNEIEHDEFASDKKSKPKFRIDAAHEEHISKKPAPKPRDTADANSAVSEKPENQPKKPEKQIANVASSQSENPEQMSQNYHSHSSHEQAPAPHFDVVAASKNAKARPGRSEAIWGQLMAYAGVGVLTVGTVMVLWGYFGMVEQYASTGWLLSTAGQMLLLLGIVTLVSGGMQQTTHEVTERIEYLGGRMIRIEQSTDQLLKGPHFAKQRTGSENVVQADNNSNST